MALVKTSSGAYLGEDAAKAYEALNVAFRARFGKNLYITSGARTYAQQVEIFTTNFTTTPTRYSNGLYVTRRWNGQTWYLKPGYATAAVPGTSNHEYPPGKAADFGSGVANSSSVEHAWMRANAHRYGWQWTGEWFVTPEPWHWEKNLAWTASEGSTPLPKPEPEPIPEEEEEDMAKRSGFYYTRSSDKATVYLLSCVEAGWWMEYLGGSVIGGNNPIALTMETGNYVPTTEAWANAHKISLDRMRDVSISGDLAVAEDPA